MDEEWEDVVGWFARTVREQLPVGSRVRRDDGLVGTVVGYDRSERMLKVRVRFDALPDDQNPVSCYTRELRRETPAS